MNKPLSAYEKDLRKSIKVVRKLNKAVSDYHWCKRYIEDYDEYFQSKFGDRMSRMDDSQL